MKTAIVNALATMLDAQTKSEFNKAKFYAILNFKNAVAKANSVTVDSLLRIQQELIANSRSDAYTAKVTEAYITAFFALEGKTPDGTTLPVPVDAPAKPAKVDWRSAYVEAVEAGKRAANAAKPVPMMVGTPKTLFSNDIDHSKPTYIVNDGVCGFGYVKIKNGNSPFARWCAKNGIGFKGYYGGREIGSPAMTQSMERNGAACAAMVEVLSKYGVDCYSYTRID